MKIYNKKRTAGLTLIELLVALFIAAIIMVLLAQITQRTITYTSNSSTKADLIREAQIAQQVISGRVNNAVFIYDHGDLTLSASEALTTRNPRNNSPVWQVGTDPIIATIQPPTNPESSDTSEKCYKFMAFYPIKRSTLQELTEPSQRPAEDSNNNDKWVLMQYQKTLLGNSNPPCWDPERDSIPTSFAGDKISGQFLTDYVVPDSGFVVKKFDISSLPRKSDNRSVGPSNGLVEYKIQLSREIGRETVTIDPLVASVAPRNWQCGTDSLCHKYESHGFKP